MPLIVIGEHGGGLFFVAGKCNAIGIGVENERGGSEDQNGIVLVDTRTQIVSSHIQQYIFKLYRKFIFLKKYMPNAYPYPDIY